MTWSDDRVEQLKNLLADGLSASQIASELGIGRNAVIGKVHRLGLGFKRKPNSHGRHVVRRIPAVKPSGRPTPSKPAPLNSPHTGPNVTAVKDVPLSAEDFLPEVPKAPTGVVAAVLGLTARACRWPIGHPKDPEFRFCCAEPLLDRPYCAGHCREAYDFAATARASRTKTSRLERQFANLEE